MIAKIKKLATSTIMGSDQDIENFVRIMELPRDTIDILQKSKSIIKSYYTTGSDGSFGHISSDGAGGFSSFDSGIDSSMLDGIL